MWRDSAGQKYAEHMAAQDGNKDARKAMLTHTVHVIKKLFALFLCAGVIAALLYPSLKKEQTQKQEFFRPPVFYKEIKTKILGETYSPSTLLLHKNGLYVSYVKSNTIDVYVNNARKKTIVLTNKNRPVYPLSFAVSDKNIIAVDYMKKNISIFDKEGKFLDAYKFYPDQKEEITPSALYLHSDVLYVADMRKKRIFSMALIDIKGTVSRGELVNYIPDEKQSAFSFSIPQHPASLLLTDDGRLLVSDVMRGKVIAYTHAGAYMYTFQDKRKKVKLSQPMDMAVDGILNPKFKNDNEFDPSGIREQGRYHVVDAFLNRIFVYDSAGYFLFTYGEKEKLKYPRGIAVNKNKGLIYVADAGNSRVVVYRYRTGF